ncbi:(2Fe-2S)-binding protein [Streptomyces lichenis]|uniref:(2Fe-2S)-binding protein n=1 Tax=Streptomyces lichenis TaxID=2306967 RepID=A0ABT0I5U9_9ACTN|nr:(2Fe-2S)-binding protein [Streptomyces lichenis]MCK8676677.1 (2Fe-2S)-binding protein [Streptomyces lichenis]
MDFGAGDGGWQPVPQGEYDADATAFVQLPPEGVEGAPLEAPGHGYVPPEIPDRSGHGDWQSGDPDTTAQWSLPPDPGHGHQGGPGEAAPSELTGQWTIPLAPGDLPEESGEYAVTATSSWTASAWMSGNPPATLPGGAPAPWATEPAPAAEAAPDPAEEAPGAQDTAEPVPVPEEPEPDPVPDPAPVPDAAAAPDPEPEPVAEAAPAAEPEAVPASEPEPVVEPEAAAEPEPVLAPAPAPEAVPASAEGAAPAEGPVAAGEEHPHISYLLRVNGTDRPVSDAWIGESLLYVLRERLGLAGAKDGCSQGECGACNVQVDGRLVASCLVPAATAAGSEVTTVEGLAENGEPSDVQRALARCGAVQCGFCIPGMAMTVHDLLEGNHAPSELETRKALCGNLCRCSGYRGVLDAVREVVAERGASAAAAAEAAEAERAARTAPDGGRPGDGPPQPRIPHQIPHPHDGGTA